MAITMSVQGLIVRPASGGGVFWGKNRVRVLCRYGDKELWQVLGSSIYRGRFKREYVPGEVCLIPNGDEHFRYYNSSAVRYLSENSRVSKVFFMKHRDTIDRFFGFAVAKYLRRGRTVVACDLPQLGNC